MKILIPLLLLTLGLNANEVVYGSKSGTLESDGETTVQLVDVATGWLGLVGGAPKPVQQKEWFQILVLS
jgi:hypothetical protein|tara:strand:- start:8821 stop:9027 length:207 start_codon:yes stop_codon:yes gene_type:complete